MFVLERKAFGSGLKVEKTQFLARALGYFADAMQRAHKDYKLKYMAPIKRSTFICLVPAAPYVVFSFLK